MDRILFSGKISCENVRKSLEWSSIKSETEITCVAKMKYKNKEYWAVNGVGQDERKNINALKQVIKTIDDFYICRVHKGTLKKNVLYYHYDDNHATPKWITFSYSDYEQKRVKSWKKKKIEENKRLFSCCERKLIAKLDNQDDPFKIFVAFKPCFMCENAFLFLLNVENNRYFEVHYFDTPNELEVQCTNHLKELNLI